jgi:hypothetical protein
VRKFIRESDNLVGTGYHAELAPFASADIYFNPWHFHLAVLKVKEHSNLKKLIPNASFFMVFFKPKNRR